MSMRHYLLISCFALLCGCKSCDKRIAPQRPSNGNEPDSVRIAVMEGNQVLARQASEQLKMLAEQANDTLNTQGEVPFTFHDNGCWIRIIENPEGPKIEQDQELGIAYTLKLTDGTIAEEREMTIKAGRKQALDAIDYALTLMTEGGKAEILAPWALLYGREGTDKVPPYSQAIISLRVKRR
ncbi:MAG: FKBP-type peptidyl-prolyl cis-trans isomerase [Paludibacteraceae bacterium]|nr:FKBP-type peptidyl-prolyl cis-trans isomerase [Paludibacteraceae bacterium]